jgi:hypothetical protein
MAKSSTFHIQLDGVNLNAAQTQALAADLDRVVASHMAKIDAQGDFRVGRPLILNPGWLGIWIRNHDLGDFSNPTKVADLGKTLTGLKQEIH